MARVRSSASECAKLQLVPNLQYPLTSMLRHISVLNLVLAACACAEGKEVGIKGAGAAWGAPRPPAAGAMLRRIGTDANVAWFW